MTYRTYINSRQKILREMRYDQSVIYQFIYAYEPSIQSLIQLTDYMDDEIPLSVFNQVEASLDKLINKRIPLAYILGYTWFLGYKFIVSKNVLCPRIETEFWTDSLIQMLNDYPTLKIIDMCCGTGVIGLSIKKQLSRMQVTLSDISSSAIENTNENAKILNLSVDIIESDLFAKIPKQKYDVFICNPPYIDPQLKSNLTDLAWEPDDALYANDHGLAVYESICSQIKPYFNDKFILVLEIGADQAEQVKAIILKFLNIKSEVWKDQNNLDRIVIAKNL